MRCAANPAWTLKATVKPGMVLPCKLLLAAELPASEFEGCQTLMAIPLVCPTRALPLQRSCRWPFFSHSLLAFSLACAVSIVVWLHPQYIWRGSQLPAVR